MEQLGSSEARNDLICDVIYYHKQVSEIPAPPSGIRKDPEEGPPFLGFPNDNDLVGHQLSPGCRKGPGLSDRARGMRRLCGVCVET